MARRTVFLVAFCVAVVSVPTLVAALNAERAPPRNSSETVQLQMRKLQETVGET